MAFTAFDSIATALWGIFLLGLVELLHQFGLWRWLGENLTAPYRAFLDWLARVRA